VTAPTEGRVAGLTAVGLPPRYPRTSVFGALEGFFYENVPYKSTFDIQPALL